MARDPHLIQRGRQYYLKLPVPRPLRRLALFVSSTGKPKDYLVEPLGPDYTPARVEADRRTADYRALFARAAVMTSEAVAAEVEAIRRRADRRKKINIHDIPGLHIPLQIIDDAYANPGDPKWAALAKAALQEILGEPQRAETVNQAAEIWLAELERAGGRPQTLDGHRLRVKAFVDHAGDVPLASVTRAQAADFLTAVAAGRSNRTTNNYAQTMLALFRSAHDRGRFAGENPFDRQRRKVVEEEREAFTAEELQKIFTALPVEIAPKKHSPETALPWSVRIAAYTGMRLEEIAQLTVADVKTRGANGGTVVAFDIHNGGNNHLKNKSSERVIPVHSQLVRMGLLKYIRALPKGGQLFPGLKRRASKGDKIGARLGELFRKLLIDLDLKRPGLCFHSLRHTVAHALEAGSVSQTDAARVLGHAIAGESYGTYSSGPGLKRLAAVVEEIRYESSL